MLEKLPDALGHALRGQRAGLDSTAFSKLRLRNGMAAIEIRSLAFVDHGPLPVIYTADGDGRSPPLQWSGVPASASSVVLLVEDADSPTPHPLVHGIVVDLPAGDGSLPEGALDTWSEGGEDLKLGRNSYLQTGWLPPDPPPAHGVHRYVFQVFALGAGAGWSSKPGRDEVLNALAEHAIASGCLIGTYERHDTSVRSDEPQAASVAVPPGAQPT